MQLMGLNVQLYLRACIKRFGTLTAAFEIMSLPIHPASSFLRRAHRLS